jgi:hypothetical protein
MEDVFDSNKETKWGGPALKRLSPLLDDAAREYAEQAGAYRALQKAQEKREEAARQGRGVFVSFRRVVRATFGRSSREYRDLADRRRDEEEEPLPPATGN